MNNNAVLTTGNGNTPIPATVFMEAFAAPPGPVQFSSPWRDVFMGEIQSHPGHDQKFNKTRILDLTTRQARQRFTIRALASIPKTEIKHLERARKYFPALAYKSAHWGAFHYIHGATDDDFVAKIAADESLMAFIADQFADAIHDAAIDRLAFPDIAFDIGHNVILSIDGKLKFVDWDCIEALPEKTPDEIILDWIEDHLYFDVVKPFQRRDQDFSNKLHLRICKTLLQKHPHLLNAGWEVSKRRFFRSVHPRFQQLQEHLAIVGDSEHLFRLQRPNGQVVIIEDYDVPHRINPDFIAVLNKGTAEDLYAYAKAHADPKKEIVSIFKEMPGPTLY